MTSGIRSEASGSVVSELSVVLPAFNEEGSVEAVVRRCVADLDRRRFDYEVLVVNDGSRDRTGEILTRLSRELPKLRPLGHARNLGYGAALRTGFGAATRRFVFYMDADGQLDITDLDRLLPLATDEAHIVTGYRMRRRDPPVRRLNAWLFGRLVRLLLGVRVRDLNCAFKLVPRQVLDDMTLESTGALINAELYARALNRGFGIKEVGVHHYPRAAGSPTGGSLPVIARAFRDLLRMRRSTRVDYRRGSARAPRPAAPSRRGDPAPP